MHPIFSRETLHLSKPSLRGIFYFLLTVPLFLLVAEIVARTPLGNLLPAPSVNADSFLFDAKIYQLESQLRRDGTLDCLFLGSSVANSDIDPAIVEQVYREQSGETIHCYNLGLPALTIENATPIAQAVIARFHPKVIIYAILPRDVHDVIANVDYLERIDWVTYNRGEPSRNGWLVNNSYGWRYFLTWRYWLTIPNRAKMEEETRYLTSKGFQPAMDFREPYIENLTMTPARLREAWDDPQQMQAVKNFIALQQKGVKIIFLEGPAYHESDSSDAQTWLAYDNEYLPTLVQILESNQIPFWRTESIAIQIPKEHWYDWLHLNQHGAATFSQWLGEMMAENKSFFK
ncbi:MAG: hypothetical protein C4583_10410 [Anaerolineaceae bacterium]|nr:MAG: hypothetical protein C4583_10410 [Anaerolineaceae bacterium]